MTNTTPSAIAHREAVAAVATRLHADFSGRFNEQTIERLLDGAYTRLRAGARYEVYLALLAERSTRDQLVAATRHEWRRTLASPTVLFLCIHNTGRSQMAAAWLRHLAGDQVRVRSAGSAPAERIDRATMEVMAEVGLDLSGEQPAVWTEATLEATDVVVTMGCGDACPVLPGKRYLDWEVEDPAGRDATVVRSIRDDIRDRVVALLGDLGVPTGRR